MSYTKNPCYDSTRTPKNGLKRCPQCWKMKAHPSAFIGLRGAPIQVCSVCGNKRSKYYKKWSVLRDLFGIGPDKPLGYLPLSTLEDCKYAPETMVRTLRARDLYVRIYTQPECDVGSGALYASDLRALAGLLAQNKDVIIEAKWPMEPLAFFDRVARIAVSERKDPFLYRVIGLAFADPRFKPYPEESWSGVHTTECGPRPTTLTPRSVTSSSR